MLNLLDLFVVPHMFNTLHIFYICLIHRSIINIVPLCRFLFNLFETSDRFDVKVSVNKYNSCIFQNDLILHRIYQVESVDFCYPCAWYKLNKTLQHHTI